MIAHSGKLLPETVEQALADGTIRLLIKGEIEIILEAARKMTEMEPVSYTHLRPS